MGDLRRTAVAAPATREGSPHDITPEFTDALDMFAAAVARNPDGDAIRYFDGRITYRELDELTDAFAAALLDGGLAAAATGWRSTCRTCRSSSSALVGTWKAGGIAVSINPMNRERELALLLHRLGRDGAGLPGEPLPRRRGDGRRRHATSRTVITTSELDYQTRDDPRVVRRVGAASPRRHARTCWSCSSATAGRHPPPVDSGRDDIAFLTYTSGTTGPPKGAMNTHGNVVFNAQAYREWCGLTGDDVVLGVAPLFHITGLIAHITAALLARRAAGAVLPVRAVAGHRRRSRSTGRRSRSARSRCSSR